MSRYLRICLCCVFTLLPLHWSTAASSTGSSSSTTWARIETVSIQAKATRPNPLRVLDDFVSLTTLEVGLFADAADGRLDNHSLLTAALVASGIDDPETLGFYESQVAVLADRLRRSGKVSGSPREQVRAVFEFMHSEFLYGGYRLDATDMTTVLQEGRFNCVSSSVLFCCLCSRFGIAAEGLEIPGHAMTRVELPDGELRIEATCPQWFRLTDDPQRRAELIRKTVGLEAAAATGKAGGFRGVSGVELVATIYYNRGVDLLGQREFAAAMTANCKAVRLDRANKTAWGNLLATLNNWAIAAGNSGQFTQAAKLLEAGLAVEPEFKAFTSNYTHIHHRWVEALCDQGRHEEAIERLDRAASMRPHDPWFRQASQDVLRHWSQTHAAAEAMDSKVSVRHEDDAPANSL